MVNQKAAATTKKRKLLKASKNIRHEWIGFSAIGLKFSYVNDWEGKGAMMEWEWENIFLGKWDQKATDRMIIVVFGGKERSL